MWPGGDARVLEYRSTIVGWFQRAVLLFISKDSPLLELRAEQIPPYPPWPTPKKGVSPGIFAKAKGQ